jgi:PhnB protein
VTPEPSQNYVVVPYLTFGGNCRQAFTRYQEILGGELSIMGMDEVPDHEPPPEQVDLVMHAALSFGGTLLMASDDPDFDGVRGMAVSLSVDSANEAERVFAALAEGGEVQMPLGAVFWSPAFGMCTDRFGTPWMVGTNAAE